MANILEDLSHDSVNRFLLREQYEPKDLFDEVKPHINLIGGILSGDDTVIDKPYSDPLLTELIGYFWSGKHHRVVKGIQLITLYYADSSGKSVPVNYRIYNKLEGKTKNDYLREDSPLAWLQKSFSLSAVDLELLAIALTPAEEQYILSKWLLTASDYGVPQKRQRAIWVGSKFGEPLGGVSFCPVKVANPKGEITIPEEINHKFTVGDAISDLAHIPINPQTDTWNLSEKGEYAQYLDKIFPSKSGLSESTITGCRATVHTPTTQQKYADTKPGEKEPTTWAYRLSSDGFSPTLRAGSGNRTAARPIHYEHPRVITVREAARLHSFPDWFDFGTSKLAAHKAIGNSVPPLLAYAIASQIWAHLEKHQSLTIISQPQLHSLELQTIETLAGNFRIIYLTTQQPEKINQSISDWFPAKNIRTKNKRSPPMENLSLV